MHIEFGSTINIVLTNSTQDRQCTSILYRCIKARSCNHCCSEKAIRIT